MYYSNDSNVKSQLESWYNSNLANYSDYISTGNYFCEQAKVKHEPQFTGGNATLTLYSEYKNNTFACEYDGNNKGVINGNIGLITYDEAVFAGAYDMSNNSSYYLYNGNDFLTMSSAGFNPDTANYYALTWRIYSTGNLRYHYTHTAVTVRPVINLKSNVKVTGLGTSADPYIVKIEG